MLGSFKPCDRSRTGRALALVNEPQLIRSACIDIFVADEEVR